MKLVYSENDTLLTDESGTHQVMMAWEKPYMEACIDKLNPYGRVLEIGYGLGFSAERICSFPGVTEYTVIECSPVVWEKVEEFKERHKNINITLIKGRWQDVLYTCGSFDCVFFDDYSPDHTYTDRFDTFLMECLKNHSVIGTRLSCYSTLQRKYLTDSITSSDFECTITIPPNCKYARGNKMFIQIFTKISDTIKFMTAPTPVKPELLPFPNHSLKLS
jgi:spermidine synthase